MEKEVVIAIEKLAAQMGTTGQYLWGALLKQAPISAAVDLILDILVFVACWVFFKVTKNTIANVKKNKLDEIVYLGILIGWIALGICFFSSVASLDTIIAGYFNPEYWALHKVLSTIK